MRPRDTTWAAGAEIRLRLTRRSAQCPHCGVTWPEEQPPPDYSCPECGEGISVRSPPGGTTNPRVLVGEDRALLRGEARTGVEPESLACPNCGAPMTADGAHRRLTCGSCNSEVVVPDEIWRRVHTPDAVTTWWLWLTEEGSAGITEQLSFQKIAVGADGRLYAIGSYADDDGLFALDTDPMRLLWNLPMPGHGQRDVIGLVGDELWWADLQGPTIQRLNPDTGATLGSFTVAETSGVQSVVDMGDGTAILHCYPDNRLERVSTTGEPRKLWPPSGFLGRLFGRDRGGMAHTAPVARPGIVSVGRIGRAWSGGLCVLTTPGGAIVGLLDETGKLLRTAKLPGMVLFSNSPEAGPDGSIFAIAAGTDGGPFVGCSPAGELFTVVSEASEDYANGSARPVSPAAAASAVGPDGGAWLADTGGVERYDSTGKLRWHWHAE